MSAHVLMLQEPTSVDSAAWGAQKGFAFVSVQCWCTVQDPNSLGGSGELSSHAFLQPPAAISSCAGLLPHCIRLILDDTLSGVFRTGLNPAVGRGEIQPHLSQYYRRTWAARNPRRCQPNLMLQAVVDTSLWKYPMNAFSGVHGEY